MAHVAVDCLLAAFVCNLLFAHVAILGATGLICDRDEPNAIVDGATSMMNAEEMEAMQRAERRAALLESERGRSASDINSTVDCVGLPWWIASPVKKWFTPDTREGVDTQFYVSTRSNRARVEVPSGANFSLSAIPGFDPRHRTVVIVHGFNVFVNETWIEEMTNAILDQIDANVFAVDWGSGGDGMWNYLKVVVNSGVIGDDIARFLEQLTNEAGLRKDDLHLIGHSIGAHICGFVSRSLKNVSRITGLDPAQPCYGTRDANIILDSTDAKFVDVIHTNGRLMGNFGLGLPYKIGHVDFYVNGGKVQPGCLPNESTGNKSSVFVKNTSQAFCSHSRSHDLFIESIRKSTDCAFWGHPWDREKNSMQTSIEAKCDVHRCSEMGFRSDQYPARGVFLVLTKGSAPFCIADPRTTAEMKASHDSDAKRRRRRKHRLL